MSWAIELKEDLQEHLNIKSKKGGLSVSGKWDGAHVENSFELETYCHAVLPNPTVSQSTSLQIMVKNPFYYSAIKPG